MYTVLVPVDEVLVCLFVLYIYISVIGFEDVDVFNRMSQGVAVSLQSLGQITIALQVLFDVLETWRRHVNRSRRFFQEE